MGLPSPRRVRVQLHPAPLRGDFWCVLNAQAALQQLIPDSLTPREPKIGDSPNPTDGQTTCTLIKCDITQSLVG